MCKVTQPPFFAFSRVLREDEVAHLGVDVEVPVALKVSLLALCIVEQEAVFDDEESLYRGRQWKQQWVNPVGLKGTNVCRCSQDRKVRFLDPALPIMQHNSTFHSRFLHEVMVWTLRGSSSSEDKNHTAIFCFLGACLKSRGPLISHTSHHTGRQMCFKQLAFFFFFFF